ncbi:UNVERIFIED_CONTAM: hypothetical protein Sradi_7240800, partial [Sesamum radiatum]
MEMKGRLMMIATLLLFLLVAVPSFSKGSSSMVVFAGRLDVKNMDSEVYVIDYRGPETHTYIPPPNRRTNMHMSPHHNPKRN